jgi:hypothetical protein
VDGEETGLGEEGSEGYRWGGWCHDDLPLEESSSPPG